MFLSFLKSLQEPGTVGHLGPRLCLKHFREEDIIKTKIGGVRLKTNACPLSESSNHSLVTNDMILVTTEGTHIPTNTVMLAAISPFLKDILQYNHDHYEEETKLIIDYPTETVESFLELANVEDVCLSASEVEDVRSLILDLGVNQQFFSVSPVENVREYLSRYSSKGESSTRRSFQDQGDCSLSKEVDRSEINYGKTNNIHSTFFQTSQRKSYVSI